MAQDNRISMPGAFGGLMRYDDEYVSKLALTPAQVMIFVIALVVFTTLLWFMFPTN